MKQSGSLNVMAIVEAICRVLCRVSVVGHEAIWLAVASLREAVYARYDGWNRGCGYKHVVGEPGVKSICDCRAH